MLSYWGGIRYVCYASRIYCRSIAHVQNSSTRLGERRILTLCHSDIVTAFLNMETMLRNKVSPVRVAVMSSNVIPKRKLETNLDIPDVVDEIQDVPFTSNQTFNTINIEKSKRLKRILMKSYKQQFLSCNRYDLSRSIMNRAAFMVCTFRCVRRCLRSKESMGFCKEGTRSWKPT